MISGLILQNKESKKNGLPIAGLLKEVGITDVIIIADMPKERLGSDDQTPLHDFRIFSPALASRTSCLRTAIRELKGEKVILIDADLEIERTSIDSILVQERESSAIFKSIPVKKADDRIEMPNAEVENLIPLLKSATDLPLQMAIVSREFLTSEVEMEADSTPELIFKLWAICISQGELSDTLNFEIEVDNSAVSKLPPRAAAQALKMLVNRCNIEELFPNHPWTEHQQESVAACYHTLAAMFIRFGDLETAQECLNYSDKLEDSPRSSALKAFIASERGETLGAVANMVSSLQQYEVRKRDAEKKHYLTFAPKDLEIVNTKLNDGLEALNRKDNSAALGHFFEALDNFDALYAEAGLRTQ